MTHCLLITLLLLTASLVNAQTTGSLAYDVFNGTTFDQRTLAPVEGKVLGWSGGLLTNVTASGGGTWGSITGTLADQTDLQSALNAKLQNGDSASLVFNPGGLQLWDEGNDHTLTVRFPETTTSGTLNLSLNNAATRSLTLSGNATLSGTNTGNVSLAGTPDYLTLSGQVITQNAIDLTTDVTGTLPLANGGRGNSNNANVAYVRAGATGGTVGNAAAPFPNINAAYAAQAGPNYIFDLDNGTHTLTVDPADISTTNTWYFRGTGPNTSVIISTQGETGAESTAGEDISFGIGPGSPLVIQSDHSCNISFDITAGTGGNAASGTNLEGASGGSVGGWVVFKNAIVNTASMTGGPGGEGDGGVPAGPAGLVEFSSLEVINCTVTDTGNLVKWAYDSVVNEAMKLPASYITSGTLGVARGGTGATTLTANNVLLGNGTSALQTVAPGTSGNVLTSNGTTWTSSAPSTGANPAGSGSELQFRSSGTAFGAITSSSVSGANVTLGGTLTLGTGGNLSSAAANRTDIKNGTTAQNLSVFNTYTSEATNERLEMLWSANQMYMRLMSGASVSSRTFNIATSGVLDLTGGSYVNIGQAVSRIWQLDSNGCLKPAGTANTQDIGTAALDVRDIYLGGDIYVATAKWSSGTGSPEGVKTAPVGSLYTRLDGGAGTTLYVKESGTGSTGWVAK